MFDDLNQVVQCSEHTHAAKKVSPESLLLFELEEFFMIRHRSAPALSKVSGGRQAIHSHHMTATHNLRIEHLSCWVNNKEYYLCSGMIHREAICDGDYCSELSMQPFPFPLQYYAFCFLSLLAPEQIICILVQTLAYALSRSEAIMLNYDLTPDWHGNYSCHEFSHMSLRMRWGGGQKACEFSAAERPLD